MNVAPVLELLRKKIGFNPESIGVEAVVKSIREHIETSGAASIEDFINTVNQSIPELNRLIESVLVQETSFFRNKTPFVTLQSYLKQFVLPRKIGKTLRILCIPCATGEEAYSIAMVLMEMKLAANHFHIYAGDISEQVIKIAEGGRYDSYSFRGEDEVYRRKYFIPGPDGYYVLKDSVRTAVHFARANILADNFLLGHEPYDVIFCRNLLIYFDADAKERAITALSKHLAEEGVLFVGHAEGSIPPQFGFAGLDYPMSFAFARPEYAEMINDVLDRGDSSKNSPVRAAVKQKISNLTHEAASSRVEAAVASARNAGKVSNREDQAEKEISRARQLAEAGAFGEVEEICEKLLAQGVENAWIFYLLGQSSGSSGNYLQAEEYLKKAIYLDGDFYDALIYLSYLAGRMGNPEKAVSYRKRAQRVKQRKEGDT